MGIATWGILYLKTALEYLLIIAVITFGLAFFMGLLLRSGGSP